MNQQHLMDLLIEASTSNDSNRINDIHIELAKAANGLDEMDTPLSGVEVVLSHLFIGVCTSDNRDILPKLFPAFAIMCGEKGTDLVSHINWEVYNAQNKDK